MAEELTTRDTQATANHSQVWRTKPGGLPERKMRELGGAVINEASRGKLGVGEQEV